jgi:hypothetical protein
VDRSTLNDPGALFIVHLSPVPSLDAEPLDNDAARVHACKLANALNRAYGFSFAPVFDESPEPGGHDGEVQE